ncbi:MAG: MMPL family transporter [Crocinitomicaceae bacterium]|nr:MMPL family transporter [Crocinitomicaceae bacterium]MDG1658281.1 MMPL family transporter [Crocinitomicaceae bacterium]
MVGESAFKKYVWIALTCFLGITIFFLIQTFKLKFDYDFEKFFPIEDEETDFYFNHRSQFESDNDFLLIAIEREAGIFDKEFLEKVSEVTKDLESVPHIQYITSITNTDEVLILNGGTTVNKPYFNPSDFDAKRDSTRIYKNRENVNSLVAENGKSVCIFIRHVDYISKKKSDELIIGVQAVMDKTDFDNVRIAGRTIGQKYYSDQMFFEMILFIGLSAFLIIFFLLLAFRSGWGIMIPQVVIFASMIWVVGAMGLSGEPMNIILTVLPSIIFIVGMSDVVHLVSRYLDALRTEKTVFDAIILSAKEVGLATLLTSVTTSIGFFSLYFVRVQPIQIFGIVMGFGVLVAFLLTFLTLPALFYIFPGPKFVREKPKDHYWQKYLQRWFPWVIKNRRRILILGIGLVAIFTVGMFQIESDNYLMDDLKADEPLKLDFNFLDDHYGGVRPFELAVEITDPELTVWDMGVLKQADSIEQFLIEEYGLELKVSLVNSLKIMNRSSRMGDAAYFKLPESKRKLKTLRRGLRIAGSGEFYKTFVDSAERIMRISGTMNDLGNNKVTELDAKLNKFLAEKEKSGIADYTITGTAHLFDKNLGYLSISLVKGLAISILIVALLIGLIYRSWRILIISIIPNVFPLLVIAGLMGYFGIELKTSTAIIFTIAFGIAVDDTIHFLGKFKYELMQGKSHLYALKRSYMTTGKAMILTTLILCAGFLLLICSSFLGTYYMGVMLCITLFVALIADLTLLPVLLLLFYKPTRRERK